jgi:SAM-dependent methyltransferase
VSTKKESELVQPKNCPICGVPTHYIYRIHETKNDVLADWYRCQCGVVFQKEQPKHECYDTTYRVAYELAKESDIRGQYAAKIYTPIIEEATYGRMMLDVGFNTTYNLQFFEKRGWLVWGIDVNKDLEGKGNIYHGDFETYDFSPNIDKEKLKELEIKEVNRTFDLIWMSHVLEHFRDPIKALKKAYNLLSPTGIIYVAVPDIDFINKTGTAGFPHWKSREHYIMWTERALVRELENVGFNVILKHRNFSSRFSSWYDVQILAQKRYF